MSIFWNISAPADFLSRRRLQTPTIAARGCNNGAEPSFWLQRRRLRSAVDMARRANGNYRFIGCFETVKHTVNMPSEHAIVNNETAYV